MHYVGNQRLKGKFQQLTAQFRPRPTHWWHCLQYIDRCRPTIWVKIGHC